VTLFLFQKTTMEWHQVYYEMIYRLVRKQNECLLHEIAVRENIPIDMLKPLMPSMHQLRSFLQNTHHHTGASSQGPQDPDAGHSQANA
jgi:hypothetical protein